MTAHIEVLRGLADKHGISTSRKDGSLCPSLEQLEAFAKDYAALTAMGEREKGPAEQESLRQRAMAWNEVVAVLDEVPPGWNLRRGTGVECAVSAIRGLVPRHPEARVGGDMTDSELLTEFVRICREQKPVGHWPSERVCKAIERLLNPLPSAVPAGARVGGERFGKATTPPERASYHQPDRAGSATTPGKQPEAQAGGAVFAWRHPDEVPDVPAGGSAYFWVAVKRNGDGRVYSFPAQYLNAMLLCDEWGDGAERSGNRYQHGRVDEDDGSFPATGWHSAKEHGEYESVYQPLLGDGDELVAWREVPSYPATTPPAKVPEVEQRYNELLLAVARKFPGESRHETALRYIREAESGAVSILTATPAPKKGG